MQNQQRKLRRFGADDGLSCPNCSKLTFLTRRSPDSDYNVRYLRYERQIFTCSACDHQIERIVDIDGKLPG
jgi:DNA-directed RNA polymerase subunit RPC12/RpoP